MNRIVEIACTVVAVAASLCCASLVAWEDHPEDPTPTEDLKILKIIANMSIEAQECCLKQLNQDEEQRNIRYYNEAH
jgi:hypothetical protein